MNPRSWIRRAWLACLVSLLVPGCSWGHAVVFPERVDPGSFEKFVLRVPTEKQVPTTSVRLLIPDNVRLLALGGKPGWTYQMETDSSGRTLSVTWSGSEVPPGEFVEFELMGRAPGETGKIVWKAFQTYKDGTVVSWTGPPDAPQPASITRVERGPDLSTLAWLSWVALVLSALAVALAVFAVLRRT